MLRLLLTAFSLAMTMTQAVNWLENCVLIGRFLASNSSFDFDLLQNRLLVLSSSRHENDFLSPSIYLSLTLSTKTFSYDESISTFRGFVEDAFSDTPCALLIDASERPAAAGESLIEVCSIS